MIQGIVSLLKFVQLKGDIESFVTNHMLDLLHTNLFKKLTPEVFRDGEENASNLLTQLVDLASVLQTKIQKVSVKLSKCQSVTVADNHVLSTCFAIARRCSK